MAVSDRITPAGAGKTPRKRPGLTRQQDHPRRCGENFSAMYCNVTTTGSPPQVRGKQNGNHVTMWNLRITPAGAGKTPPAGEVL